MGEQVYSAEDRSIMFSDSELGYRCLCTFPTNDETTGIDIERVRSLALLGAAVVLAHYNMADCGDCFFIPECVPDWIKEQIDKAIGYKDE
jgi:hypothetical protein